MSDFGDTLNVRLQASLMEFTKNTDVVALTSGLVGQVTRTAQASVANANQAETLEEKLQLINQGMIDIVGYVEQTATFSKEAVYKYRFESALLKELIELSSNDLNESLNFTEEVLLDPNEGEEENDADPESEEQKEGIDPTE